MTTPQCPLTRPLVRAGAACTQWLAQLPILRPVCSRLLARLPARLQPDPRALPVMCCAGVCHRQDLMTLPHAQQTMAMACCMLWLLSLKFNGHVLPASMQLLLLLQLLLLCVQSAHRRWPSPASRQPCFRSAVRRHHRTPIWLQTQQHGICRNSWTCQPPLSRRQPGLMGRPGRSLLLLLAAVLMGRYPSSSQQDSSRREQLRNASHLATLDPRESESSA